MEGESMAIKRKYFEEVDPINLEGYEGKSVN